MARPQKNNADYFSHDKGMRNDPKVIALRRKYKAGYGVYNMLLEALTEADFFTINLNPLVLELMAGDFDVEVELLNDIIQYCSKIGLLIIEGDKIYSNGLCNRLQPILDTRNRAKEAFLKKKSEDTVVSTVETTQKKGKEKKGKEKKEIEEVDKDLEIQEKNEEEEFREALPEVFINEEEKLAAVDFLKSHSMFILLQKSKQLKPNEVLKHFDTFYDKKFVLGELEAKSRDEVLKHFLFWMDSHMLRIKKTEQNGTPNNYPRRNRTVAASADQKRTDLEKLVSGMRGVLLGSEFEK